MLDLVLQMMFVIAFAYGAFYFYGLWAAIRRLKQSAHPIPKVSKIFYYLHPVFVLVFMLMALNNSVMIFEKI